MIKKLPFFDLVIAGPDMSGTSSQIGYLMKYLQKTGYKVGDMRGNEKDALFHAEEFNRINKIFATYGAFRKDVDANFNDWVYFSRAVDELQNKLKLATFVDNPNEDQLGKMTWINPKKNDAWIFEEPTKRGAGQVCRVTDSNMSYFWKETDPKSLSTSHSVYRRDEFLRFREVLINLGIPIIRSRSEESGAYQIADMKVFPNGTGHQYYFELPGHKTAFANPPTHIFIAHAPEDWTEKQYLDLKKERSKGRILDDLEVNAPFQVMVNNRYATNWMKNFYEEGCKQFGSTPPKIYRFNLYDSEEKLEKEMIKTLEEEVLNVA